MNRFPTKFLGLLCASSMLIFLHSCNGDKPADKVKEGSGDSTGLTGADVVIDIPDFWAAAANGEHKYGYINTKGEWMIQPKYSRANPFSEGFAFVSETKFPQLDFYLINEKGEKVADPEGVVAAAGVMRHGIASVGFVADDNKTFYYRFVTKEGEFLPVGNMGGSYLFDPDGIFPVKGPNGKFGFQDRNGKWVITPIYKNAAYIHESGLAPVENDAGVGYIDKSGKSVTAFKYAMAFPFFEGKSIFVDKQAKWGYIDSTGKETYAPEGYELYPFFSGGLVGAKQGKIWGFMDANFNMVIPPTYYELGRSNDWGRFKEGLRAVPLGEKSNPMYIYIDTQGKVVLDGKYFSAGDFNQGIAPVAIRSGDAGLYGVINREGKWAVKPIFTDIVKFAKIHETGGR